MKKSFLYSMLLAASVLTGCSSEDAVNAGGQGENTTPTSYISVNIVSTPESGTRAADDKYEAGSDAENTVKKVRFYFFDASGNAASVKANLNVNYYDWAQIEGNGTEETGPVERKLNAVLLIETKNGDALPAQIVAVVNPEDKLGSSSLSLSELRNKTSDYATLANATDGTFVMCNSVYADAEKNEVSATKLTSENFQNSSDAAQKKPVNVYVERNVAKVRVAFGNNVLDNNNRIMAKSKNGDSGTPILIDNKNVYIQFDKWNISGDINLGNLSKHINPTWAGLDNNVTWNDAPYFRSYWASAVTPGSGETVQNQYANYNSNAAVAFTGNNFKYCNENATLATGIKNTQVIIPAKIVDANGNPYTVAEFAGQRYIATATSDEADLKEMKDAILTYFENDHKHYCKEGAAYKEIAADDITFKTATAAGKNNISGAAGTYYVYPCLNTTGTAKTWYKLDASGKYVEDKTVGDELLAMPHAKIWKNGGTYFFFDINHINNKPGVVRNHLYDASLTAIYGLGTPVYDPSEVIIPEKPVEDDTYIAAQVKILSWRVVSNSPTLDWGK